MADKAEDLGAAGLREQAARLARDAEWRKALALSHFDAYDGLHFDCAECAPLRGLLNEGSAPSGRPLTHPSRSIGNDERD